MDRSLEEGSAKDRDGEGNPLLSMAGGGASSTSSPPRGLAGLARQRRSEAAEANALGRWATDFAACEEELRRDPTKLALAPDLKLHAMLGSLLSSEAPSAPAAAGADTPNKYEPSWVCRILQLYLVAMGLFYCAVVPFSEATRAQLSGGPQDHPLLFMTGALQGLAVISFAPTLSALGIGLRDMPGGRLHALRQLDGPDSEPTDKVSVAAASFLSKLNYVLLGVSSALIAISAYLLPRALLWLPEDTQLHTRAIHCLTSVWLGVIVPFGVAGWYLSFATGSSLVRHRIIQIIHDLRTYLLLRKTLEQ